MSNSNLERCMTWIAAKPKIDEVRSKLATVEEKLLALSKDHPKREDFQNTMQALLNHLKSIDASAKNLSLAKTETGPTSSGLSYDADPNVKIITDPTKKRAEFELLKAQFGISKELLKQNQLVA